MRQGQKSEEVGFLSFLFAEEMGFACGHEAQIGFLSFLFAEEMGFACGYGAQIGFSCLFLPGR